LDINQRLFIEVFEVLASCLHALSVLFFSSLCTSFFHAWIAE